MVVAEWGRHIKREGSDWVGKTYKEWAVTEWGRHLYREYSIWGRLIERAVTDWGRHEKGND